MSNGRLQPIQRINLAQDKSILESNIRDFLYDNPEVLGEAIGVSNLQLIQKERVQPSKGRLDLLFEDEDNNRYEVELQVGRTNPDHIVRAIEYWDIEQKRYPKKDHIAILIAENITGRFFNIISRFNGAIPMIALQLVALPLPEDKVGISLINILDLTEADMGDKEAETALITDESWWEARTNKQMMKLLNEMYSQMAELCKGFSLNYNKQFIGLKSENDISKNFITFVPRKGKILLRIYCDQDKEIEDKLTNNHVDIERREREYYEFSFTNLKLFNENKEDIFKLIENAKTKRGV